MSKGHLAVCGMTQSGKSYLAKALAGRALKAGRPVLVLDPFLYGDWPCSWITKDPEAFMRKAKASTGCLLVVDECGVTIGRGVEARGKEWLVTASRHQGHRAMLLAQRATQIEPIFRDNISELFLFAVYKDSAEIWAETFNDDALRTAPGLKKYHFLHKELFKPCVHYPPVKA